MENFGFGTTNNPLLTATTTYIYSNGYPLDGSYTITNGTFGNPYDWHQTEDHTIGDVNGKALIVNAGVDPGEFYRTVITGLCQNTTYEFSAWLINLVIANSFCSGQPGGTIPINVTFEISNALDTVVLSTGNTGPITEAGTPNWNQYGLVFNTGNQTSVILKMINNGTGGCGNDLAIDDIEFKSCGDSASTLDSGGNTSLSLCISATPYILQLNATPDGSVYNTPVFQWQESTNGTIWNDINGANNQTLNASITTSGFYRAKIAEDSANLNNNLCISFSDVYPVTVNPGPAMPNTECWETATLNPTTCTWQVTGSQPIQPNIACYENVTFNDTTCTWDITGTQPLQPLLECWETAMFNATTCTWDVTGTQPTTPSNLECWETTIFNDATCNWDIIGTQPLQPLLECWETAMFNATTCTWDVTGTQPTTPSNLECWETAIFNDVTCNWDIIGTQPIQPNTACYENATFNDTTCTWDITGTQPLQPLLECWETATFNTNACSWIVTGIQPTEPDPSSLECGETAIFNTATCIWEVSGSPTLQPNIKCFETASFNELTCTWEISGTLPIQPMVACWQTVVFNETLCAWELSGIQPEQPNLKCGESAFFNTISCEWEVSGSATEAPEIACYEMATFNATTCTWDITGTQPIEPITECWESTTFNTVTCSWEVSGSRSLPPDLECYESATFSDTNCSWVISGTMPNEPPVESWETAIFDSQTCTWSVSITPTVSTTELNVKLCDGNELVLQPNTEIEIPNFVWNTGAVTNEITINEIGVYTVEITDGMYSFETIVYNVYPTEVPIIDSAISYGADIEITTTNSGDFMYSLDGVVFQESPQFESVEGGAYTIYVKSPGCDTITSIDHLHFFVPQFFTPNNDSYHDYWNIGGDWNSIAYVYIIDRFGKILVQIFSESEGWDGTYLGNPMVEDDYWYVIVQDSGKQKKGHFSLIRR
ncbi:T9SS type B sorting domain-containing protein [Maribacter sp. CXY002]|uniref:T9SS type B sorting domain-containing protein n=1 Tax=Maribacter luteocoastalis TaxID=3407671 RepID=UPI003B6811E3